MPQLLKTSLHKDIKGKKGHYHIAYMRDDGSGITSENSDHSHDISFEQAREQIIDNDPISPMYGMIMQEGAEGGIQLSVATDGHTHTLEEYEIKGEEVSGDEKKILNSLVERYFDAKKFEEESIAEGEETEEMYVGHQWDASKKQRLEAKDRACITANRIEEKIDNLSGYQRQNRTDIKYLPMEGGDQVGADMLSAYTKYLTDACNYPREETKIFEDTAISGRGLFHVYEDFERNISGDIIIERFPWNEAHLGEHSKDDAGDCEILFKEKWYSISKIKSMYPDKADKFTPEDKKVKGKQSEVAEDWDKRLRGSEFINTIAKKYKLVEVWQKEFRQKFILVNDAEGFVFNSDGWSSVDINSAKSIEGFRKIPRSTYKMRVTRFASDILLDDEYVEDMDFPIIPTYAKFRDGKFWGKVRGVKELQTLLNKAYSQFTDIINKMVNYGWFYDPNTFTSEKEKRKFQQTASSPGFMAEVNDTSRVPVEVQGVRVPTELIQAIQMFSNDIREIMNVNVEMSGQGQGQESGIAIKQKITQQLIGNDFLFDNLSFAKKKLGAVLLTKIAKKFKNNPEGILRVISNQSRRDKVEIDGKDLNEYDPQVLIEVLKSVEANNYDFVISESPTSPSVMTGTFLMLMELAGKGQPIPIEAIVDVMPVTQSIKNRMKEQIAASKQEQADMEKMKYDTEIQKSQIAAQSKAGGGMPSGAGMVQ